MVRNDVAVVFYLKNFFRSFLMWLRKLATVLKSLIFTMKIIVTVKQSFYIVNVHDFYTVTISNKVNMNDFQTVTSLCSHMKCDGTAARLCRCPPLHEENNKDCDGKCKQ